MHNCFNLCQIFKLNQTSIFTPFKFLQTFKVKSFFKIGFEIDFLYKIIIYRASEDWLRAESCCCKGDHEGSSLSSCGAVSHHSSTQGRSSLSRQVNKLNMMIKVMMMMVKISHLFCSSLNPQQRSRKKEQYLTDR